MTRKMETTVPNMSLKKRLSALLMTGLLAGCASTAHPVIYHGLDSAAYLAPNTQDKKAHTPYLYTATDDDWSRYTSVMLDPVVIYDGADQQFGKLSEKDRKALADYMQAQFAQTLGSKYSLTSMPGAATLRVHVTLTGAAGTIPVLATVKQLVPVGVVLNTIRSVADKKSRLMGSVTYAVEIYDSTSNRLLRAFISQQYPAAENIPASVGTLSAAETGIRKGAKGLLAEFQ